VQFIKLSHSRPVFSTSAKPATAPSIAPAQTSRRVTFCPTPCCSQDKQLGDIVSEFNYRMDSLATNVRDMRIDNHIIGEVFHNAGRGAGYDANALRHGTDKNAGLTTLQQIDAVGIRFDAAKRAYEETGEHKYLMMQKDFREIAAKHLGADLRSFRLSQ
jgi:hypothetical protein